MGRNCYICDIAVGPAAKDYVRVFGDGTVLQSGKKLHEVIADIVEQTLHVPSEIASVVCKKCQKACSVYDSLKTRLQVVKCDLRESFSKSNIKRNGNLQKSPVTKDTRKVVVPASKLHPLPANFLINMAKLAPGSTGNIVKLSSSLRTIATSQTSIQNSKTTIAKSPLKLVNSTNLISSSSETENENQLIVTSVMSNNRTKNPVMSFNVNSLPRNFLSKDAEGKSERIKKENGLDDNETENNDDQPMEIDEDSSLAADGTSEDGNVKLAFDGDKKAISNLFDMGLLLSPEDSRANERVEKLILDKLKMLDGNLDDDDDEEQTIVMEDGTTIIRMSTNQQVTYDGEHYALVPAASDQENDDNHDSNDESQIELQVSGDEETANAIIAAAQEQGGAFIKVESGEMYRVQSVQSKTQEDTQEKMHIENLVEALDKGYKCLLCEKNKDDENYKGFVGDAEAVMAHLMNKHTARVYICQICGDVMRRKVEYTKHLEEHAQKNQTLVINKTKLHECDVCNRKYNSRTLLTEHMNLHTGERPFICAACGKSFASKYTMQAHVKTHEERPRPYKCHCGKAFFTQQNLAQHGKTHSGIKEFVCTVCNKAFATQHNLEVHYVVHTGKRPFLCQYCNKGFARKAEVKDHMRTHTGERPFACDTCGATFTQRSNLHSHKRATHLDDKRHHCTQCSKRFKRRRLLEYHIKAAHTGERPLQCEVCRATFVYPEHYKKHVKIHSGERPYVCEVCGKSFTSRDNRNTHRFVHSDKKPFECLTCGVGYMRKQLLYAHMNTTGHVAESIVVNQPKVIKAVDNIFETTTQLELDENDGSTVVTEDDDGNPQLYITGDKKIVLQDKSAINVLQGNDNSAFLIHNFNGLIEANADDKLQDQTTIVTTDEKGGTMRLIQVQLEDGKSGWVAINN